MHDVRRSITLSSRLCARASTSSLCGLPSSGCVTSSSVARRYTASTSMSDSSGTPCAARRRPCARARWSYSSHGSSSLTRSDASSTSMKETEVATRSSPLSSLTLKSSGDLARSTSSAFLPLSPVSAASPLASAPRRSLTSLMTEALQIWAEWQPIAPAEAWVHRIAINAAVSYRRKMKLREVGEVIRRMGRPEGPPDPQDQIERRDLAEALAKLPPKQAAAIVLRHYHGYTNRAIAQALGIPERTVASRLAVAKERLRVMLKHSYGPQADIEETAPTGPVERGFAVAD